VPQKMLALRGVLPVISVVVYKKARYSTPIVEAAREYFGMEPLAIRGLGRAWRYETRDSAVYFVEINRTYEIHTAELEKAILEGIGEPKIVVSINPHIADMREGIFIHTAGNVTGINPLGGGYTPKTVAPTNPGTMGLIIRAVHYFARELESEPNVHIEATHDLPARAKLPYLSFEVRGNYHDLAALALVAALGKHTRFKPYLTIGMSYYADEFIPVILRKKKVPAYHVPFYLAHHLSEDFIRQLVREGKIEGVAYGKGVPREKLPF